VTPQAYHAANLSIQPDLDQVELDDLILKLTMIHSDLLALELEGMAQATNIHTSYQPSARNLLHYLALRRHDKVKARRGAAESASETG
jgi:hypothetical protein